LAFVFLLVISIARTGAYFNQNFDEGIYTTLGIVSIALYPLVGLFLFFHTHVPVPGAMDDLAGVAVAGGGGKVLHDNKSGGGFRPEHTEVMMIGMGCEEAGLRGSKRFVQKHLKELKDIPTYAIFVDGVYDEKFLTVIHKEICTGAKHDPGLVKMAQEVAAEHKWPIIRTLIPLGASDASIFSLAGIKSTCLLCQDTSKLVPNYHTRHDTLEKVRPESLAVTLQLIIDMLKRIVKE
jgi:Zn-dependent M28 family amino/carboxypeptidase